MREYVDSDQNKDKRPQNTHDDPMDTGTCHGNQEYEDDEECDLKGWAKGIGKAKRRSKEHRVAKDSKGVAGTEARSDIAHSTGGSRRRDTGQAKVPE